MPLVYRLLFITYYHEAVFVFGVRSSAQGGYPIPWGARWTPSHSQVPSNVIKRAHVTRLGRRPLGPYLAHPRATQRLGGAAVSCQYFPCSFVLAPRAPGLRLGTKAPLPLRASSRGARPGPRNTLPACHRLFILGCLSWLIKAARAAKWGYDASSSTQASSKLLLVLTEVARSGR